MQFYKKAHKIDREFQLWQEGIKPKLIQDEQMMRDRLDYIHNNPVKRGYIDEPHHWRYSSDRGYFGIRGLLEVERAWREVIKYAFSRRAWERGEI